MTCISCGRELTGRQKKYCGQRCQKQATRWAWIRKVYGLDPGQYQAILDIQGGVCGLCSKPFPEGKTPHIDHEHGGSCRGIVHAYCNTRLLHRLKDWKTAQAVADYLKNPPASQVVKGEVAPGRPKKKRQPRRRPRK